MTRINALPYCVSIASKSAKRNLNETKEKQMSFSKYQKYCKAVKFVRTVKKQTLESGVTIEPFSDTIVISHKDCLQLGGFCSTALGMKRLINKTAKDAAKLELN